MTRGLLVTTAVLLALGLLAGYAVTTGAGPRGPLSASLTVHDVVLGQTSTYIGATEAGVFFMDDLTDLGINTYRLWTKMAELEWWDDDDARAATPWMCTEVGTPSIAEIKADQGSGFANTIPWDWWEEQFTGTYYTWSGHSREEVIQQCVDNGITPVLVLRNRDDGNQPDACGGAWAPDSPIEQADLNEWWEHCFAIAYWLNVLHSYGVTHFEVLNEPDLAGQGWHGTQAEYVQLIQTAHDAVQFANDMAGIGTVIHAPVVSNSSSPYIAYSLDNADDEIAAVDYHTYADDPSASLTTVKATIGAHNPDGVTEPIWVSEWGTYTSSYDTFARAMLTAQQLLTFSKEEVEGVTVFGMYDWGGFDGLLDTDRARSETYYAYRLMTRGLKGGKERLDYAASGINGELMVTRDAEHVYILAINGDATIDVDLSALGLGEGEVNVYEYSDTHKDAVVATPAMAGGQFSFSAPASGVVLAEVTPPPLAVELASFSAVPGLDHIAVRWETVSEVDTLGFNLYRSQAHDGEYVRLNGALIHSRLPGSPEGGVYTWLDRGVERGTTYYYRLEDLNVHGRSTLHGPVSATVDPAYRYHLPSVARH